MELNRIEKLLQKYEEGETSLAEERQLRDFFLHENVPEHLKSYELVFLFSKEQKREKLPEVELPEVKTISTARIVWSSIAAVLVVAMVLYFFNDSSRMLNNNELGTIDDQEVALEKTKETLAMVSQFMNAGTADLKYLKEFNDTKNKIIEID